MYTLYSKYIKYTFQGEESGTGACSGGEMKGKEHGRLKLQEQDQLIKDLKQQLKYVDKLFFIFTQCWVG